MDVDGLDCNQHYPPSQTLEESSNNFPLPSESIPPCEASTNSYVPQVSDDLKPNVGQEFPSIDEVHTFYNNYARECGFSVRGGSTRRSKCKGKENELLMKEYLCCKEGERILKNDSDATKENKRRRGFTREGCKARLRVVKSKSGPNFVVSIFEEAHNHPLATPRKVGFLRSHRKVSAVKKSLTQQFSLANISTPQQMSILELQSGGLGNIGCTEKDIRNEQTRIRKLLDGHDVDLLYDHFVAEQENNPAFRYVIEADSDGKLKHVIWADAYMRMAYSYFGDVIVFDTTYNTNRYGMIFAPILGVNNHWKTVTFSGAFLSDESTESFEWLFSQFLSFMPGPPPGMIITDQDLAIEKAIASKLAGTHHRFCIWHIVNKFSEKLGPSTYEIYYSSFKSCIWDSESREEFDARWLNLLETANLKEHKWLNSLYEVHEKWVPSYVRHIFSAGMSSSQRAESHHSFFKRYGDKRDSFTDFIQRFNRGLARQRHDELNDDHVNINEQPCLKTPLPIEKQMADSYTRVIFYKIQDELWDSMLYKVTSEGADETNTFYKVDRLDGKSCRVREVVENKASNVISCSCKKFEWEGIPCRHIFAFFRKNDIVYLPTNYILRRWTKEAKLATVVDGVGVEVSNACDISLLARRTVLSQLSNHLIDDVVMDEDEFLKFKECLIQYRANMKQAKNNSGVGDSTTVNRPRQSRYSEPSQVSFKGCGKRLKRGKETSKPKTRKCNYCGIIGATHDSRNCPKKHVGPSPLGISGTPSLGSPIEEDNCSTGNDDDDCS